MNKSDIIAVVVAVVAFAAGYGIVSWLVSIARKGLDSNDYRNGLPKRQKFGEPSAPLPDRRDDDSPRRPGTP